MKRVMLYVAYDGTKYHGYQIQDNADTIEGRLTDAVRSLTGEVNKLVGGSRTDAGVHSRSNVVVFDTDTMIPADKFKYAINQKLPEDIRVVKSMEVDATFHPRHCDTKKTYEYHILNSEIPDPVMRLYNYHTYNPLDVEKMRQAAEYMVGEHDFNAFCAQGATVESTIRTVYSVEIEERPIGTGSERLMDREIIISVSGNGFLYNMVRIMAGTLIEVGRGHIKPDAVKDIIASKERKNAGPTAPACGLILAKYEFV